MKRKFFSMMVAACAALFSFSGLTGCGGGGGSEKETYGVVTLSDFADAQKGFYISIGSRVLRIVPIGKSGVEGDSSGDTNIKDDPKASGSRTVNCEVWAGSVGPYYATVDYTVDWPAGAEFPTAGTVDGSTYQPTSGTALVMTIYDDNGKGLAAITDAVGGAGENTKLSSAVGIAIDFRSRWCTAYYTLQMQNDAGKYAPYPGQSASGPCFAEKTP